RRRPRSSAPSWKLPPRQRRRVKKRSGRPSVSGGGRSGRSARTACQWGGGGRAVRIFEKRLLKLIGAIWLFTVVVSLLQ
ncbi:hypothetical protein EDB83DRAFT_2552991, partial [Lactarius deliciosus]